MGRATCGEKRGVGEGGKGLHWRFILLDRFHHSRTPGVECASPSRCTPCCMVTYRVIVAEHFRRLVKGSTEHGSRNSTRIHDPGLSKQSHNPPPLVCTLQPPRHVCCPARQLSTANPLASAASCHGAASCHNCQGPGSTVMRWQGLPGVDTVGVVYVRTLEGKTVLSSDESRSTCHVIKVSG